MGALAPRVGVAILLAAYLGAAAIAVDWRGVGAASNGPAASAVPKNASLTLFEDVEAGCLALKRKYPGALCGADLPALKTATQTGSVTCTTDGSSAYAPRVCVPTPTATAATPAPLDQNMASESTVYFDQALDPEVASRLSRAADQYIAAIEKTCGCRYTTPPIIYVFGRRATFQSGLQEIFGYPADASALLASGHGGVFLPGPNVVVVNWEGSGDSSILRHELAHVIVRQLIGKGTVPTWFDEGVASQDWWGGAVRDSPERDRQIYGLRSLAEDGRVKLGSLTFGGRFSLYEYLLAAESAAALVRQQPGIMLRLLRDVGAGTSFPGAFEARAGVPLAQFEADFARRFAESLKAPKLFRSAATPGGDVPFYGYGFTPGANLQIEISGDGYHIAYAGKTDDFGAYAGTFGSTAPPGLYEVTITGPRRTGSIKLDTTVR